MKNMKTWESRAKQWMSSGNNEKQWMNWENHEMQQISWENQKNKEWVEIIKKLWKQIMKQEIMKTSQLRKSWKH